MCPPFNVWLPGCYLHPILHLKNVGALWLFTPCYEILATGLYGLHYITFEPQL